MIRIDRKLTNRDHQGQDHQDRDYQGRDHQDQDHQDQNDQDQTTRKARQMPGFLKRAGNPVETITVVFPL